MKTFSLFIVSYAKDFPWLDPLYASIKKYCTGFDEVVLGIPASDERFLQANPLINNIVTYDEEPGMEGFMCHQLQKCCADLFCSGDYIVHTDSDCVFTGPISPGLFLNEHGWAINNYTPYKFVGGTQYNGWWPGPWKECTEKVLGEPVPNETMRNHCACHHRDIYASFRDHVEKVQGKSLEKYLLPLKRHMPNADSFSEFNALGSYCMAYQGGYDWRDTEGPNRLIIPQHQFWSFHGVNHPDVQVKLHEFGLLTSQTTLAL